MLLAIATLVPVCSLSAQTITMSATPVAKYPSDPNSSTNFWKGNTPGTNWTYGVKQIAVSNDIVYGIKPGLNVLSYWNPSSNTTADIDLGKVAGFAICTDDYDNLVFAAGNAYNAAPITSVRVVKKSSGLGVLVEPTTSGQYKDITISNVYNPSANGFVSGRTDFFFASGNCYEGRGALWFTDGAYVIKVELYNGTATYLRKYTLHKMNVTASDGEFTEYFGGTSMSFENVIRPIGYNRFLFQNNNVLALMTIQEQGSVVEVTDYPGWYRSPGADLDSIGGHEILVRPNQTGRNWDCKITVVDRTTGNNIASGINALGTAVTKTDGTSELTNNGLTAVNAWCELDRIDDQTLALYTIVPRRGVAKYLIKVNDLPTPNPCTNVVAGTPYESDVFKGRQDVDITWTAPSGATPTEYAVYAESNIDSYSVPVNTTEHQFYGATAKKPSSGWVKLGTTNSTKFTHEDAKWWQQEWYDAIYPTTYRYKVVPIFNGIEGTAAYSNEVKPIFLGNIPQWDEEHTRNYNGYCKVQLFWKQTYGLQPNYYNVYRNGKMIAEGVAAWNYIDQDLSPNQTYTYEIEACYNLFDAKRKGDKKPIEIGIRDWGKPTYKISKVYDYSLPGGDTRVDDVAKSINANFKFDAVNMKQAAFSNGNWYILTNGSATGTSIGGNVLRVSAGDPNDANDPYAKSGKNVTNNCDIIVNRNTLNYVQSCGIAVDEGGNIFMRELEKDANGIILNNDWYSRPLLYGVLYSSTGSKIATIDFTGIDFAEHKGVVTEPYPGRVDYYYMTGNLSTVGGTATLYIAPTSTRAVYVVELKRTATGTVTATKKYSYVENGANSVTGTRFYENAENFAFPIKCKGREGEFIHQLRSHAYVAHKNYATTTDTRYGVVFETRSRVNNAGGCTLEFNGELFVITPQNLFSVNTGNFFVGMAERKEINRAVQTAATADLTSIIPAASWFEGAQSSVYSDANGVFLHAEVAKNADGTIVDTDNNGEADYAYIYMYVPATRIAKFKLETSSLFPPSQVAVDVNSIYGESEGNRSDANDLLRYDAVASWDEVIGYGETDGGNQYYNVKGYEFRMVDPDGVELENFTIYNDDIEHVTVDGKNVVKVKSTGVVIPGLTWKQNTTEYTYTDGGVDKTVKLDYYTYTYTIENVDAIDDAGNKREYFEAYVTVLYKGVHTTTSSLTGLKSVETYAANFNGYTPESPGVRTSVLRNVNPGWSDWDNLYYGNPSKGEWDPKDAYFTIYQVDMTVTAPVTTDPVSNYELIIDKANDAGFTDEDKSVEMNNFYLYDPEHSDAVNDGSGLTGYRLVTNGQIPGDYDFSMAINAGKPTITFAETDYYYVDEKGAKRSEAFDGSKDLSKWNFSVNANYAATNDLIAQTRTAGSVAVIKDVQTGVEEIDAERQKLNIFPIPTTIAVTIQSPEEIKKVEVYSLTGKMVKSVESQGETTMELSVDELGAGYYFIRVNNYPPVKMIKK